MSDTETTAAPAEAAPTPTEAKPAKAPKEKKPKAEKPPKAPKIELLHANGETRPRAGSKTSRPWEIADEMSRATGKPAVRKDVIAKAVAEGRSSAMAASQYGRWRRFNGLGREKAVVTAPATTTTEAQAAPASDVTVEQK